MPLDFVSTPKTAPVLETDIRAELGFLASDALQGRKSGSSDELLAGAYIASQLQQAGAKPGAVDNAGNPSYIQAIDVGTLQTFTTLPTLRVGDTTAGYGADFVMRTAGDVAAMGPLQHLAQGETVQAGAVVYLDMPANIGRKDFKDQILDAYARGARTVALPTPDIAMGMWDHFAHEPLAVTRKGAEFQGGLGYPEDMSLIFVKGSVATQLQQAADGTPVSFAGEVSAPEPIKTWNTVAVILGTDPDAGALLLTAHMDHLGVADEPVNGDSIYNGADDDASGCVAVIELAKQLGKGEPPKRTVYFVTYGSEEVGGYGSNYFKAHPPVPLDKISANLEFEMIGHPHPQMQPGHVLVTGYDYSNLAPSMVSQGAKLMPDPYPDQDFFRRSDNYLLAKEGVVAHTFCSYDPKTNTDYHQLTDDVDHIDFPHMTTVINSLVDPVKWLANSEFQPAWNPGQNPKDGQKK